MVNVSRLQRVRIINLLICSVLLCAVDTDFYESFLMGAKEAALARGRRKLVCFNIKNKSTIKRCPQPLLGLTFGLIFMMPPMFYIIGQKKKKVRKLLFKRVSALMEMQNLDVRSEKSGCVMLNPSKREAIFQTQNVSGSPEL